MPRQKNYNSKRLADEGLGSRQRPAPRGRHEPGVIDVKQALGEASPCGTVRIECLKALLGTGCDEWITKTLDALALLIESRAREPSTVKNQAQGLKVFLQYLAAAGLAVHGPDELTPSHVHGYASWLKRSIASGAYTVSSARGRYQAFKGACVTLNEYGYAAVDVRKCFPRGTMDNTNSGANLSTAYSDTEFQRVCVALKEEVIAIHQGSVDRYPSEVMSAYLLMVLVRTGANLAPLIAMSRSAVRDGLVPGFKRLRLSKARSHKVLEVAIKTRDEEKFDDVFVPLDAVGVIQVALKKTESLVARASPAIRDRVWLYESLRTQNYGEVSLLAADLLNRNLRTFSRRYGLTDDHGAPLFISPRRIRQTTAARLLRLSDGDVVLTSAILGNTRGVIEKHYAGMDQQLRLAAGKLFASELVGRLRGKSVEVLSANEASLVSATPAGRCKDTLRGELAPSNALDHCSLFTSCLFCRSFAISGEKDDLWRLFSFQAFMLEELANIAAVPDPTLREEMREMYVAASQFIDEFVPANFPASLVRAARKKADSGLHPFWELELSRARLRNAAQGRSDEPA